MINVRSKRSMPCMSLQRLVFLDKGLSVFLGKSFVWILEKGIGLLIIDLSLNFYVSTDCVGNTFYEEGFEGAAGKRCNSFMTTYNSPFENEYKMWYILVDVTQSWVKHMYICFLSWFHLLNVFLFIYMWYPCIKTGLGAEWFHYEC